MKLEIFDLYIIFEMNQLVIKFGNVTKKVNVLRTNSAEDLGKII